MTEKETADWSRLSRAVEIYMEELSEKVEALQDAVNGVAAIVEAAHEEISEAER